MADGTNGVLVKTCAVWVHPTSDAGAAIMSGKSIDKMKVLPTHCEIQIVRQAREKTKDAERTKKKQLRRETEEKYPHRYLNSSGARCAVEERFASLQARLVIGTKGACANHRHGRWL